MHDWKLQESELVAGSTQGYKNPHATTGVCLGLHWFDLGAIVRKKNSNQIEDLFLIHSVM